MVEDGVSAPIVVKKLLAERTAQADEERRKQLEEERLQEQERRIKDLALGLLVENIPDPDEVKPPKVKKKSKKQLEKEKEAMLGPISKEERKKLSEPKVKVEFPFDVEGVEDGVMVTISSPYFPTEGQEHSSDIDVSFLPHTFTIDTNIYNNSRVEVRKFSRETVFVPNDPDRIGSPGHKRPKYKSRIDLREAEEIVDLLSYIRAEVTDGSITPNNLTDMSVIYDEARRRQQEPATA